MLAALAAAVAPQVPHLPAWVTLLLLAIGAWRWAADLRGWKLPPLPLRVVVVLASTAAIFGTYRTLNGIEAGTAFLVLMAAAKLLETRTSRDLTVVVFISWFLLYAALLRDQSLLQLPWLLGSAWLTAIALMRVHASAAQAPARHIVRRTSWLLLQAAPLALLLFLLFPRLPGPFWGIDTRSEARTGLDDEMTPGDVSDLSASGEVAFRARFFGATPPPEERTGAARCCTNSTGASWSRPRAKPFHRRR